MSEDARATRATAAILCGFAFAGPGSLAAAGTPQISAFVDSTCAVVSGAAYCWGYNATGQLGNGGISPGLSPTGVSGLTSGVSAISIGLAHACAVVNGGAVCWGFNGTGQLGNGGISESHVPVAVSNLSSGVTAIGAGDGHSCAIVNGGVRCWGANITYGQLGDGTADESHVPVQVTGLTSGATALSVGRDHSCAVISGAAYCWGGNGNGQLGNGGTAVTSRVPVPVNGFGSGVATVEAGGSFSCGVVNGAAQCWGLGVNGQLGNGGPGNSSSQPVQVSGLASGVSTVSAGSSYHSCAVFNGAAQCWGYNNAGQLGNPDGGGGTTAPIPVSGLPAGVAGIAAGGLHTCAIAPGGIYCWGYNSSGQLGVSLPSQSYVPLLVFQTPVGNSASDFNRDGRSDLLYRNFSTGQVYRLFADGLTLSNGAQVFNEANTAWKIVADADFNGDGVTDLLYRNDATGQVFMLLFNASGFVSGGGLIYTEANLNWKIVHTPDIDGDGKADILWWNALTGQVYAMLMNGLGITAANLVYTEPNTAWRIVATGDFAGSGKRNQLLWRNLGTGQVYLMTVGYSAGAFGVTGQMIYQEANLAWKIIGAADFDGNGKSDILWRNDSTGGVFVLLMNGPAVAGGGVAYQEPNLAWKIVAQGDYNGDGRADLLWRNDSTGQVYMMLMNGIAITSQAMVYTEGNTAWKILGPWEYGQ